MRMVVRYFLNIVVSRQTIAMPSGALLLDAQMHNGSLVLWAVIDTSHEDRVRHIWVIPTGMELPPNVPLLPIATVQVDDYGSVNVFEEMT